MGRRSRRLTTPSPAAATSFFFNFSASVRASRVLLAVRRHSQPTRAHCRNWLVVWIHRPRSSDPVPIPDPFHATDRASAAGRTDCSSSIAYHGPPRRRGAVARQPQEGRTSIDMLRRLVRPRPGALAHGALAWGLPTTRFPAASSSSAAASLPQQPRHGYRWPAVVARGLAGRPRARQTDARGATPLRARQPSSRTALEPKG